MTKVELKKIILQEMKECFFEPISTSSSSSPDKRKNIMKKQELKGLIKEVVRQCLKEGGPQYNVRTGKSQVEQPGVVNRSREIQYDPEINEDAPGGEEDNSTPTSWGTALSKTDGGAEGSYEEQDEIRLIKAMGQGIIKLLQMHKDSDQSGGESDSGSDDSGESEAAPFEPSEPEGEETPSFPPKKKKTEEPVDENHKVQHRSHKTVKDLDNDPRNVRKPSVPRA